MITLPTKQFLAILFGSRDMAVCDLQTANAIRNSEDWQQYCVILAGQNGSNISTVIELKAYKNSYEQFRLRKKQEWIERKLNINLSERIRIIADAMADAMRVDKKAIIEIASSLASKENKDIAPLLQVYKIDCNKLGELFTKEQATKEVENEIEAELQKLNPSDFLINIKR